MALFYNDKRIKENKYLFEYNEVLKIKKNIYFKKIVEKYCILSFDRIINSPNKSPKIKL